MKTPLLTLAAALLAAAPLAAQPEAVSASAAARFGAAVAAPAFRFAAASPAALALQAAGVQARSVTVQDVEKLYEAGSQVSQAELTGWFSGRRYGPKGVSAQLLVGADVLRDADAGALGGSDFKLASIGGDEPGVVPADLFDNPGSTTLDDVEWLIHDEAARWAAASFQADGALGRDTRGAFALRKNGGLLVAKYADGSYGYFFKRVR